MSCIYDTRLRGYWNELLVEEELLKLKLYGNNKIDHPTTGSKDLADSLAGSVFTCMQNVAISSEVEIEILHPDPLFDIDEEIEEFGQTRVFSKDLGTFVETDYKPDGNFDNWIDLI